MLFSPPRLPNGSKPSASPKARLPLLKMALLGVLAGAFIGLGCLYFMLVISDATLGFAASRVLGGVVFRSVCCWWWWPVPSCLPATICWQWPGPTARSAVRAAAQLAGGVRRQFVGAAGLALLVVAVRPPAAERRQGRHCRWSRWRRPVRAAPAATLFWKGALLCNVLVCLAVWMALAGRSVVDKLVAIVFPISAFVAAGFEHSIANMYLIPLGLLLKSAHAGEYRATGCADHRRAVRQSRPGDRRQPARRQRAGGTGVLPDLSPRQSQ